MSSGRAVKKSSKPYANDCGYRSLIPLKNQKVHARMYT